MDNFLDQKTFTDNQEVWAERLIKAIEDKTVNHYFTGQSDKDQKGVSWSFYGLFDSDNLSGHVVIVAYFREKSWISIKESDLFHPHMRDRM